MRRKNCYPAILFLACLLCCYSCMFMMDYVLQVSVNNKTWGTVYLTGTSIPAGNSYDYNEEVSLTAVATTGCVFDHWEGELTGNTNPVRITMNDNKVIRAVFTCSAGGVSGKVTAFGGTRGLPGVNITLNNEYVELLTTVSGADGTYSFPAPIRFGQISAARNGYTFQNSGTMLDDENRDNTNFYIKSFTDNFSDASNEWTFPSVASGCVSRTNGKLRFAYTQESTASLTSLMPIQVPAPGTKDYTFSVAVTAVSSAKSLGLEVNFGIGYNFYFAVDPINKLTAVLDADTGLLYGNNSYNDWTSCAGSWDDAGSNTLTFKISDGFYYFYINTTYRHNTIYFSGAGDISLRVENSDTTPHTPVTVDFDDISFTITY